MNNLVCLIPIVLAGPNWSSCSPGRSVRCASLGGILKAVHVEHYSPALIEWCYHSQWMCKFLSSGLCVSEFSSTSKPFLSCCLCKNIEVLRGWKWCRYGTHRSLAQNEPVIVLEWRNRAEKTTWRAEWENFLNLVILICISKLWILQELNSRRCNGGGSAAPWTFNPAMLVKHLENLRIQVRRWSTSSTLMAHHPKTGLSITWSSYYWFVSTCSSVHMYDVRLSRFLQGNWKEAGMNAGVGVYAIIWPWSRWPCGEGHLCSTPVCLSPASICCW